MAIRKITSAESPITLSVNDFSEILNVPYCLLIASGGGGIVVNLPTINSLNKNGKLIVICEDGTTSVQVNCNPSDSITENGNITSSISVSGNKSFLELQGITYINGNIWLGSTNGGSGSSITSITYSDLFALASANNLIEGHLYLITDFQMVTYIQYTGGGIGSEEIYQGSIEPMIVQASSNYDFNPQIISLSYSSDIITWLYKFTDRDWDAVLGQSTGIITSRYDTINKLYRDYDWRNIIFRRWETSSGSGVYDSIFDTGFAFQDYDPFNLGFTIFDTRIGSPLGIANGIGLQYYLDNFIIGCNSVGNDVKIGYGCTIVGSNFGGNRIGLMLVQNCLTGDMENNNVTIVAENSFVSMLDNICNNISQNTSNEISYNQVNVMNGNSVLGDIAGNICLSVSNNVSTLGGSRIVKNNVSEINANSEFEEISSNSGGEIGTTEYCTIIGNNVTSITGNIGINGGYFYITENTGNTISGNTSILIGYFNLSQNNVGYIQNNSFHEITSCSNNNGNALNSSNFESAGSSVFEKNTFGYLENNIINGTIQNNTFIANIVGDNITPTAGMSSVNPSVTIWDATAGNVEQKLSAGVVSYQAF